MFAKAVLTDKERAVDPQLGFPRGYAKLCRHAHIQAQGLISPFTEGPPQRFQPYAAQDQEIAKLKEYDDLFPILEEVYRDATNPKKYIEFLWQQLDHMGNAGFDPAVFRVDIYGNVLYWGADPGSPLAWEVDHLFPQARGGKTVPGNLRLVQWQACQRKGKKLEFLVPWWDLQLGVSLNQFLSVFASKSANFRHRAFSFFFLSGENEQHNNCKVVQGHSWPCHFRDKKNQVGLAAAALVQVQKASEGALQSLNSNYRVAKQEYPLPGFAGYCEDAVKRDLQNLGLDYGKDRKVKLSRKGECALDKENEGLVTDNYSANSMVPLQREQQWKQLMEEDKKQKLEESVQLEEELQMMKAQNVKEKVVLDQLEHNLAKQKKRVEKQRRWSETQSQYRLCLEKMIRDTLHQCVVYKEQARLNQAACKALLARLESQKSACDAAEEELVRKVKQREDLEASARPQITKRVRHQGHTDVGSCLKPSAVVNMAPLKNTNTSCEPLEELVSSQKESDDHFDVRCNGPKMRFHSGTWPQEDRIERKEALPDDIFFDKQELRMTGPKLLVRDKYATIVPVKQEREAYDVDVCGQHAQEIEEGSEIVAAQGNPGAKRTALEANDELEVVLLGYEYQENEDENVNKEESVGDNGSTHNSVLRNYSDDDDDKDDKDDAANEDAHDSNDAYDESNNGDHDFKADHYANEGHDQYRDVDDNLQSDIQRPEAGEMGEAEYTAEHVGLKAWIDGESDERVEKPPRIVKTKDDEQLDELLQEVLAMQDRVNEAMVEAIREEQDEERVKRVGKLNLDKWLQKLLLDSAYGQGQEPTPLICLPLDLDKGLGGQKQVDCLPSEGHKGFAKKDKRGNPDNEKVIGNLLKKMSLKKGDVHELDEPKLVASAEKTGLLTENKKLVERRTSPWRWVSPASKRSTSTGSEVRVRRLSPWRRSSKEDKVEERKMMEDFSKLKVGGERQQGDCGIVSNEVLDTAVKVRERSASTKLKSRMQALPQGVRERSTSTPPAKAQRNSRLVSSPIPRGSHDTLLTSKIHMFARQDHHQQRDDSDGDRGNEGDGKGVTSGIASAGASANGGAAARKADMLKKSASTRGGRGGNGDMFAPAFAGRSRDVPPKEIDDDVPASGRSGGGVPLEEDNEEHKVSLFEDLDPQEGLRASLSLAWKKAVKKFELGRPLSSSSTFQSAHLEL